MSAPQTYGDYIVGCTTTATRRDPFMLFKNTRPLSGFVSGRWITLWQAHGYPTSAGADPSGSWTNPTSSTTGAMKQSDPSGGRKLWMTALDAHLTGNGGFMAYDRLGHISGFSGTSASANTFTGTPTRSTDGVGNLIFVEIHGAVGATPQTVSCSYTNTASASGRTTPAVPFGSSGTGDKEINRILILPLQSGDSGVKSVESATISGSTGTVGKWGIVLAHPIMAVGGGAQGLASNQAAFNSRGPAEIVSGACVAFACFGGTNAGQTLAEIYMMEK
jgi:hypothetical protein